MSFIQKRYLLASGVVIGLIPLIFFSLAPEVGILKPFPFPFNSFLNIQFMLLIGAVSVGMLAGTMLKKPLHHSQIMKVALGVVIGAMFYFGVQWLVILSSFAQLN